MKARSDWERMWTIFHAALDREEASRAAYVEAQCAGDPDLRGRVMRLLRAHSRAGSFLERGISLDMTPDAGRTPEPDAAAPAGLGRYHIKDQIGEGGFAEVFLACQTEPVQRDVALKVLRAGVNERAGERVLERFETERQTLAALQHPGIATIFDAGVSADGRPFFVMEYIAGAAITAYCRDRRLSLRQRLELFMDVCAAVQHAHHKGVIHRDLKPSNVLVLEVDGRPRAKVIDFGIAAVVGGVNGAPGAASRGGARWHGGTPGYMSPEQATAADVDTRADVFSLGVVLYELLAGEAPFAPSRGLTEDLERARAGSEADPVPPSERLTLRERTQRDSAWAVRARALRPDLDWIVMKALSRDRAGRYGSAAALADDLRRFLEHRPVAAAPVGARYRARKFVRRHWFGVAVAAGAIAAAVAGVVLLGVQARTEGRLRAEAEAARTLAIRDARMSEQTALFLRQEIIAAAAQRPGAGAEVLEVVEAAEALIPDRFKADGLMEAAVRRTLSDIYTLVGKHDRAVKNAERAVDLLTKELGEEDRHTFQAINNLAIAYKRAGRPADAVPLQAKGLEFWRRVNGPEARETLAQATNLGGLYIDLKRFEDAERLLRETAATTERVYGANDGQTASTKYFAGLACQGLKRWAEAERWFCEAYEQQQPRLGDDNIRTVASRSRLAAVLMELGRPEEAEPLLRVAVESAVRRVGEDHAETAAARRALEDCLSAVEHKRTGG